MQRIHGRSECGKKVIDKQYGKRYQRVSLVAAQIGHQGKNLFAQMIYSNTMTSAFFEAWFEKVLLPALNESTKPSIIILDNARFHRMKQLQEILERNKAFTQHHILLPLPPYSPGLNCIEQAWATFIVD